MKYKLDYPKLIISILIPNLIGISSSFFMNLDWYQTLNKPWFTPPGYLFAPIWTTLYILMGISLYLIWTSKTSGKNIAYIIYSSQLALNFFWTIAFFGMQAPILGMVIIIALIIQILSTMVLFYEIDKNATYLLIPYLLWVFVATVLNLSIILLN